MIFEVDEHTYGGTTDVYRIIPADVATSDIAFHLFFSLPDQIGGGIRAMSLM